MLTKQQRMQCARLCGWAYVEKFHPAHYDGLKAGWVIKDSSPGSDYQFYEEPPPIEELSSEWVKLQAIVEDGLWFLMKDPVKGNYVAMEPFSRIEADTPGERACLAALAMEGK